MSRADRLELIGGHPALDFANTAGMHASPARSEWLTDYGEVIAWARHAGIVTPAEARELEAMAAAHPRRVAATWRRVLELRETVYRLFAALAQHRAPAPRDLAALHTARIRALEAARPVWRAGFTLDWSAARDVLLRPVYPIVLAAGELLVSPERARLKQCGRHPCGWLFLDRSKNGSRRWCSSAECGNISRVRRFRARLRGKI